MRLHAHNGVLLRVEIRTSTVNLHTDEIFVEFLTVPEQGLFTDELKKPTLLWGICEVSALKDSAKLLLFFKEGDRLRCGPVLVGHGGFRSSCALAGRRLCIADCQSTSCPNDNTRHPLGQPGFRHCSTFCSPRTNGYWDR